MERHMENQRPRAAVLETLHCGTLRLAAPSRECEPSLRKGARMANTLRIALIADIHHGIDQGTKLGFAALTLLQPFVDWVNAIGPDLVFNLGDRINTLKKDADRQWTRDIASAFTAV